MKTGWIHDLFKEGFVACIIMEAQIKRQKSVWLFLKSSTESCPVCFHCAISESGTADLCTCYPKQSLHSNETDISSLVSHSCSFFIFIYPVLNYWITWCLLFFLSDSFVLAMSIMCSVDDLWLTAWASHGILEALHYHRHFSMQVGFSSNRRHFQFLTLVENFWVSESGCGFWLVC